MVSAQPKLINSLFFLFFWYYYDPWTRCLSLQKKTTKWQVSAEARQLPGLKTQYDLYGFENMGFAPTFTVICKKETL